MNKSFWHHESPEKIIKQLSTHSQNGLTAREAERRLGLGRNQLEEADKISPLTMLASQFTDTMVLILLAATVISGLLGEMVDAVAILAIVVLNAILGFVQEYRAEKSLDAIKKMSSPFATIIRDGHTTRIEAEELVPGDIVLLSAGDRVPADVRLLEGFSLEVEESALTGESVPVSKNAGVILPVPTPLAEMANRAFMGTIITRGRARAVVVGTGMETVMGEIASMIKHTREERTPLQMRLDQLGKILVAACIAICMMVAFLGLLRGEAPLTMLMAGVSLAVAAIPEGLPAVVTVVLALGVQRMARRNAIVRKLPAVETLGCTTIICSDKTGTLTQNEMTVKKVATIAQVLNVEGEGYRPRGGFYDSRGRVKPMKSPSLSALMECAYYCNRAEIEEEDQRPVLYGDPTEGALLTMALKAGLKRSRMIIREVPFDSERKMMSVVVARKQKSRVYSKGALDMLLARCSRVMLDNGRVVALRQEHQNKLLSLQDDWAASAHRVLAFAYRDLSLHEAGSFSDRQLEDNLILVGICGMIDPPRPAARESVTRCLRAGVIPVMVTGDHPATALAIARDIGITSGERVVTGIEIDRLGERELVSCAETVRVFARVSPQHKYRIVRALKKAGHVVAMTGDGVNDAPAIKEADIGVSMGLMGTEVTKEASSMILADDDFSTIEAAIYEGRAIYDNIRKFIKYLLGCNAGEVLTMFMAALLGMPLPLVPIQILWVNLITDGLPAMALGLEPPEPGVMDRKPRSKDEGVFSRGLGWQICGMGLFVGITTLAMFTVGLVYAGVHGEDGLALARTMAFTMLVVAQMCYVFECRSEAYTAFELGFFSNRFLIAAVVCSVAVQFLAVYSPWLQRVLQTVPLEGWQWALILSVAGGKLLVQWIRHLWRRSLAFTPDCAKIRT
jgi:Ca2+-transporting ATPase